MSQDISNLSITWDDAGTVFDAIKFNVVNTNSASGSKVLNLQVDGSTVESTDKSGNKVLAGNIRVDAGTAAAPAFAFDADSDTGLFSKAANTLGFTVAGSEVGSWEATKLTLGTSGTIRLIPGGTAVILGGNTLDIGGSQKSLSLTPNATLGSTKAVPVHVSQAVGFVNSVDAGNTSTARIYWDADDTLGMRRGTNAQAFNIYNTYTASDNFERAFFKWETNEFKFGVEAGASGGTLRTVYFSGGNHFVFSHMAGGGRSVFFGTTTSSFGIGGGFGWTNINRSSSKASYGPGSNVNFTGLDQGANFLHFNDGTTNAAALGATSGHGALYLNGSLTGSDATPNIDIETTWNTTGAPSLIKANVTDTASDAASLLMDLQVDGSTVESTDKSGNKVLAGNLTVGTAEYVYLNGTSAGIYAPFNNQIGFRAGNAIQAHLSGGGTRFALSANFALSWSGTDNNSTATNDLFLRRDAANTLAQRNGTTAQTLNIYNTYTDASNYERGYLSWSDTTNIFAIGTEAAGTGTGRNIYVKPQGSLALIIASNAVRCYKPITASSDGNVDLGAASKCWRDIYLKPSSSLTPANNGDLCIEATNNTTLTFKLKGSDGTVRSGTVTLA